MALFGITPLLFVLAVALNPSTSADEVVSTIIVTAPPAYPTNPPSYTSNSIFESAILAASNFYRVEHHAVPLQWNDSLADYAQNWAKGCQFEHSVRPHQGSAPSIAQYGTNRTEYNSKDRMAKIWQRVTQMLLAQSPPGATNARTMIIAIRTSLKKPDIFHSSFGRLHEPLDAARPSATVPMIHLAGTSSASIIHGAT